MQRYKKISLSTIYYRTYLCIKNKYLDARSENPGEIKTFLQYSFFTIKILIKQSTFRIV